MLAAAGSFPAVSILSASEESRNGRETARSFGLRMTMGRLRVDKMGALRVTK